MVDLDPEIWNNKTLGEAATNGFADEEELQLRIRTTTECALWTLLNSRPKR
jgi:hypothetical protein